jgi:hypothetical protein
VKQRSGSQSSGKRKQARQPVVVRNSYSLTKRELELLTDFNEKLRFDKAIQPRISKSEIVRIGLVLARQATPADFLAIRKRLIRLHVGRRPSSAT